jgi:hypothetical protein
MAETVILPDSATLQHMRFNIGVKGSLRRASPALDPNIEPTQISKEAQCRTDATLDAGHFRLNQSALAFCGD